MSRYKPAAVALCALLLASCGSAREASRVGMERDQSSIIFGFTPAKVVGSSGRAPTEAALGGAPAPVQTPFPQPTFSSVFDQSSQQVSSGPCPTAASDAPVSSRATTEVSGRLTPGTYRWLGSGTYTLSGTKVAMTSYFPTYVTPSQTFTDNVPRSNGTPAGDNFIYATTVPRLDRGSFWRLGWQVKTDPGVAQDPEGGLVLKSIGWVLADGSSQGVYFQASSSGLLMTPFPINPGQAWHSASVDVDNGKALQLDGQVLEREVIDECGTLVEGWHVHATLTDAGQATLDYLVAPQYGGSIIALAINGPFLGVTYNKIATRDGQVKPDPLPKGMH